jgi:hypothetical protein
MLREEIIEWILSEDINKLVRGWSSQCDAFCYESDGFLTYLPCDSPNQFMEYIGKNTQELNDIVDFAHAELLKEDESNTNPSNYDIYDATLQKFESDLISKGYKFSFGDVKRIGEIGVYTKDESVVCIVGDQTTLEVTVHSFTNMDAWGTWFREAEKEASFCNYLGLKQVNKSLEKFNIKKKPT